MKLDQDVLMAEMLKFMGEKSTEKLLLLLIKALAGTTDEEQYKRLWQSERYFNAHLEKFTSIS